VTAIVPKALLTLGNAKAWKEMHRLLTQSRSHATPIVVHGPVGCGKSWGCRELLGACGFRVLELDGADAESIAQLLSWIQRTRETNHPTHGRTAVLLDDFEGFTTEARRAIAVALRKPLRNGIGASPVVITCTQVRDPAIARDVDAFASIRLFPPSPKVVYDWFAPSPFIPEVNHLFVTGDLRRVRIALEWVEAGIRASRAVATSRTVREFGTTPSTLVTKPIDSVFDATRRLLLKSCTVDEWTSHAEETRGSDLLREHIPSYVNEDIDSLAEILEGLSDTQAMTPDRFELRRDIVGLSNFATGLACRRVSSARNVGALRPPPRFGNLPAPSHLVPSWKLPRHLAQQETRKRG